MVILYNLIIGIYWFAILLASPFNIKARKFIKGRNKVFDYLNSCNLKGKNIIWFHVASLGEFEQGRPVIEAYRLQNPSHIVLLTFFSPSGYEIRKNYQGADCVCYLPMDFSWWANKFVKTVNPSAAYFVKYEFWFNILSTLKRNNIKVYCISANFRKSQMFFKWYGGFFRKILQCFTHIFVQSEYSKELLSTIHINNVSVSGDTRFDRVHILASQALILPAIEKFKGTKRLIVAGSTWPQDEDLIVKYINQTQHDCKFVIAPHEINSISLEQLTKKLTCQTIYYSQVNGMNIDSYKVLIIDNVGMLSSIYQYGILAYIGGGFGKGIHNILEAATFGLPVVFGTNYEKFKEAVDLVCRKGAFTIKGYEELKEIFDNFLSNDNDLRQSSKVCKDYIAENIGATKRVLSQTISKS